MKQVPEHWRVEELGRCCKVVSGSTPKRNRPEYWGGDIPWVTPKDLSKLKQAVLPDTPERITQAGYDSCSTTMLPKDTILFSSRAPIGLVAITGREMCTNQGFKSFVPGPDVHSAYLYWCLKRYTPHIAARGSGTTFKEVSRTVVSEFKIPLPPLAEQKRIAAILDKADALRAMRKNADNTADRILPALFLKLFGNPATNPMRWPIESLDNCLERIDVGMSVSGINRAPNEDEWGVLKVSAVSSGTYIPSEAKTTERPDQVKRIFIPSQGDLLFNRANTRKLIGSTCIVEETVSNVFLPDKIWRLVPKSHITRPWLHQILSDPWIRQQIIFHSTGTSDSMKNIGRGKFPLIQLPVPPHELQEEFEKVFFKTRGIQNAAKSTNEHTLNTLFDTLVQRAFSGKLTAKWREEQGSEHLQEIERLAKSPQQGQDTT